MDPQAYRLIKTRRDLKYSVYYHKAYTNKPTLVFLHGFPNSSYDWRHQIDYFSKLGYSIVAPDLLGYGATDKPMDPSLYKPSGIAQDVIDVLEGLDVFGPAVVIGHDWFVGFAGQIVMSKLFAINLHDN